MLDVCHEVRDFILLNTLVSKTALYLGSRITVIHCKRFPTQSCQSRYKNFDGG